MGEQQQMHDHLCISDVMEQQIGTTELCKIHSFEDSSLSFHVFCDSQNFVCKTGSQYYCPSSKNCDQ